jgi:short-subunit dehydrogenase
LQSRTWPTFAPIRLLTHRKPKSELHDEIIADGIEIAVLVDKAGFGYTGLMNRKKVIIPGAMNKLLAFSSRLMPRSLLANVARFLNQ